LSEAKLKGVFLGSAFCDFRTSPPLCLPTAERWHTKLAEGFLFYIIALIPAYADIILAN